MGEKLNTALEIAKVIVSPAVKLIDMVGGAIGTAYEPRHKRKMADATVYEINVIGEAMRNAADLPIVYDKNGVAINSEDFARLMQRAGTRLALQETLKQHNIESVVDNAYEILEKEETCSEEPVEQGWINRFFDSVADVSDEDLQKLWGKVLAGEIKQPNSYSLRTLETLKNLSKYEAELFNKISPYVVNMEGSLFVTSNTELLKKHGITYGEIMRLDECGLMNSAGLVSLNPKVSDSQHVGIYNSAKIALICGLESNTTTVSIGEFGLTRAGRELFRLLDVTPNDEFIHDFIEKIVQDNFKKIKASVYQINYIEGNRINYDETALCEFPAEMDQIIK